MATSKSALNKQTKATLVNAHIELSQELAQLRKQVKTQAARPAAAVKEAATIESAVTKAVEGVTPETVARNVTETSLLVNSAFDDVQAKLTSETKTLDNVRTAIGIAEQRLGDLHGIDVAATSLAGLIDDIDERKASFEEFITDTRAAFDDEVESREAEVAEYNDTLAEDRKREQADFDYKLRIDRRRETDTYDRKVEDTERTRKLRITEEDRGRAERLGAIEAAETELDTLRTAVGGFDDRLDAAVDEARGAGAEQAKRSAGFVAQMAAKDAKGNEALAAAQIETLQAQVASDVDTIAKLQTQLEAANARNVELATQALKSAEGQSALAELRSFSGQRDGAPAGRKN